MSSLAFVPLILFAAVALAAAAVVALVEVHVRAVKPIVRRRFRPVVIEGGKAQAPAALDNAVIEPAYKTPRDAA